MSASSHCPSTFLTWRCSVCPGRNGSVASPRNRKLAHRRTIRSAELASLANDLFDPGTTTRTLIDDYFRRMGIQPEVAMESENIASIRPLVRINLGVSILPLAAVADEARRGELNISGSPTSR